MTRKATMRLAVPDLVSNSYFPAIAAVELGYLRDEGLDVELELLFPVTDAAIALREGRIDYLAGAAHAPLYADSTWGEQKLLAALAQNMYWFLVVRPDLDLTRETLAKLSNVRIGAAPGPDLGLHRLLEAEGVDLKGAGVTIAPVAGVAGDVSFGVTAAKALEEGRIDGFWANGMGTEVAVQRGVGKVVLDARRDGSAHSLYTFPALMTTDRTASERPEEAAAVTRGVLRAQRELRRDPSLATQVGTALFPEMEAGLIAGLIERDGPYYEPAISAEAVAGLAGFARATGLTDRELSYDDIVAAGARELWQAS
ncbi:ABC transporter substrate-binding protein [Amycolatopsis rhabdoformis]|uniref:ABC transporter substrate-binding protein n=1 Tax=Amycolatopsis rhabdoformis TaxID=1448059 RepID=A0ABZ1IAY2_9PSEU|nr:ABC transporter substrate-binding protein [Amycolatopsis rhabdoformis]WSE31565.1 ABC transporter substrate-binding protein [Amycolatopsis rhabdoformis]